MEGMTGHESGLAALGPVDSNNGAHNQEHDNVAPPSSSVLSDPPETDLNEEDTITVGAARVEEPSTAMAASASTSTSTSAPSWDAVKDQTMNDMAASSTSVRGDGPKRGRPPGRGRGSKRSSLTEVKTEDGAIGTGTPGSGRSRGRGGRPRGRARGASRAGKRKREDGDEDEESDSSVEITPIATTTKSGRSISKPTSYVPPTAQSPTTNKRKRHFVNRRNPENAVCKTCLRGTSPASNMIVFCDGCNSPYHRYCHKPPIDQAVIDREDADWYCHQCESDRIVPVPEEEVAGFVSVPEAAADERQKYFSSLTQGTLVTLLTKATTLHPDLPVFEPTFKNKIHNSMSNGDNHTATSNSKPAPPPFQPRRAAPPVVPDDANYGPEVHPPNYPRPGQGLMKSLGPEKDDLQYLVDDEDNFGVFTHLYQAPADASQQQQQQQPQASAGAAGTS